MNKVVRLADVWPSAQDNGAVDVSVIMVVYRTGPALFTSIRHVLAQPGVNEFVIVDNGSIEEDADRLSAIAASEPRIRLLQGHGNIGFAKGANLGASAATGKWLVFLNPDAFLEPGCIESLVASAQQAPSPCIVGARVLNPDRSEQRGARRGDVTPVSTLLTFTRLTHLIPFFRRFEIHWESEALPDEATPVPTISGACFCVSQADFRRLRGFDGSYFLHVEDIDLCWRARQAGGSVLFNPTAEVVHIGHTSLVDPLYVEHHKGRGLARYFRKRADTFWSKVLAYLLGPLIILAAVSRPTMRRLMPPRRHVASAHV